MELFKCERLAATISQKQCTINRHGKPAGPDSAAVKACFACEGCPGLGAGIKIEMEEAMANACKVKGCTKLAQHNKAGMCCTHFTASKKPLTPVAAAEKVIAHVEKAARVQVKEIVSCAECGVIPCVCFDDRGEVVDVVPEDFGTVVNVDGDKVSFGVDEVIYLALDEAFEAKKRKWLVELSGLEPGKAVCFAAKMVEAVNGLGY